MTRVSKVKRERFLQKYKEIEHKLSRFESESNQPMCQVYKHKLKAMRTTLGLLEIHIEGINMGG